MRAWRAKRGTPRERAQRGEATPNQCEVEQTTDSPHGQPRQAGNNYCASSEHTPAEGCARGLCYQRPQGGVACAATHIELWSTCAVLCRYAMAHFARWDQQDAVCSDDDGEIGWAADHAVPLREGFSNHLSWPLRGPWRNQGPPLQPLDSRQLPIIRDPVRAKSALETAAMIGAHVSLWQPWEHPPSRSVKQSGNFYGKPAPGRTHQRKPSRSEISLLNSPTMPREISRSGAAGGHPWRLRPFLSSTNAS
jgi:hypothetical protein